MIESKPQTKNIALAILLIVLTVTVYIPAMRGGYIWDDGDYVTNNQLLRSVEGLRRIWFDPAVSPQYYPAVFTSFWLEYRLWQLNPLGYHVVNVLLHALNAVLLWLLLRRMRIGWAWAAAVIFALHPVHAESVAWITERKNVLSALFYLLSMLAYLRYLGWRWDDKGGGQPEASDPAGFSGSNRLNYMLAFMLYLCALFSKTVTASLPVAILIMLWCRNGKVSRRDVISLVPFFMAGIALGMVTVFMEKAFVGAHGNLWEIPIVERFLIAGRALWFYAAKLVWPRDLAFIYSRWDVDAGTWWQYLFPAGVIFIFILFWRLRGKIGRGPLALFCFFAATLFPALGFFDIYPMRYYFVANHYQYLASIALIVLFVSALREASKYRGYNMRKTGGVIIVPVILLLSILTWRQGFAYMDAETLWRDTLSKNPDAWMAHNNLGSILYYREGRRQDGIRHFEKAVAIYPGSEEAHNNLGNAWADAGMYDKAIEEYGKALASNPDYPNAHYNLGLAYERMDMPDKAEIQFRKALEKMPDLPEAHNSLGRIYISRGMLDRAIEELNLAIMIRPEFAVSRYNLGIAYYNKGDLDRAISETLKSLYINPDYADAHNNLAAFYLEKGDLWLAKVHAGKAMKLGYAVSPELLRQLDSR